MTKVQVKYRVKQDIERVFNKVSNHETFLSQLHGMRTTIITPGKAETNGLGCVREVLVGSRIRYLEEITEWTRPTSFEYVIRDASMPIRHYGSRIEFSPLGDGTEIQWTSHFDVPVPVIGWVLGSYMKRRYEVAFTQMLKSLDT